jgi:hypothetical protein
MKPMIRKVGKLYHGKAEVKSYDVQDCIIKGKNMHIVYAGEIMVLTSTELVSKLVSKSTTQTSKTGGQDYKLYGYYWEPTITEEL